MISEKPAGFVYLVGAGPGDPGLITLRGAECLRRADLVLYDYLVNPRVLEHAPAHAECVCLGRHGRDRIVPQEEINQRMVEAARDGKCVVRLKGGDPAIFARTAEETPALEAAGIDYEIVPGVTAALAAGSYAGIPLTHRDMASAVALVTGRGADLQSAEALQAGSVPDGARQTASLPHGDGLNYRALAGFPGTLVFYMGVTTAEQWSSDLIAGGMLPDTPAAIIRRATWADQQSIRCTLAEVPAEMAARKMRPPVVVIVGAVAGLAPMETWFQKRPLFGVRVLVTRPAGQAQSLAARLEEQGAEVLLQPAIEIGAPRDWRPVDAAFARLAEFDWLVFSSANGVRALLDRLAGQGEDLRRLGGVKLAAIGPGTSEELARYHLRADLEPGEYRAEALAAALAASASGQRFLLARASRGREVLAEELCRAGGVVEQVVCYESRDVTAADPEIAEQLAAGQIDWVTVTSSAIARSLVSLFGEQLRKMRLASISPVTSGTLRELGFEPAAEATQYTMAGVVKAIVAAGG